MPSAAITSKSQITLPKEVREKLGVKPGDRVAFREDAEGRIVVEAETVDLLSLYGILKPRKRGLSVEAMNEVIRRRALGR
jgi:AbrB family looped-hinge helix DNA binding protein